MTITDICEKYNMLPEGATVLAAVSGGKDSMCLLAMLLELAPEKNLKIICAHFDHQLRGEASANDRRFVENWCGDNGVECVSGSADVAAYAKENGLGIEDAARKLRYEFLEKTADEVGASRIATAHTANDNAETLLLNLSRGAGLSGICGIPPVRDRIIRPMLDMTTNEVYEYLEEHGIPHVEDATNAEDFCARNRIRHNVIPVLRGISPAFDQNAARCISLLREDNECLDGMAKDFACEYYINNSLPAEKLSSLPKPVAARVVKGICGAAAAAGHIDAVLAIAAGSDVHASADLPGMKVTREYDRLVFGFETPTKITPRTIKPGSLVEIPEAGLRILCEFIPSCVEIYNSFNNFYFKSDSICDNITVMSRTEGESIRLAGRGCTKTLKKLFSEKKLNGASKGLVPVFHDAAGVIAVGSFGIAERCLPHSGDDVIHIIIEKK